MQPAAGSPSRSARKYRAPLSGPESASASARSRASAVLVLSSYHCCISPRTASKPTSRTGAGASPRRSASRRSTMITSRSALQPAASKPFTSESPPRSTSILRWRRPAAAWRRSASASSSSAEAPAASSTTRRLTSHLAGCAGVKNATPCANGSARAVTRSNSARRYARRRPRSVVPVGATRTPDHDLVPLDRDLHRPVPGPVLGVDRVVLDGGVEPEPVALLAMVEGALERLAGAAPGAGAAAAAGAAGGGPGALPPPLPPPRRRPLRGAGLGPPPPAGPPPPPPR